MRSNEVKIIDGEIFSDHRGRISSLNDFRFCGVERCYFIHQSHTSEVRAWNAHQFEKKWFYCIKGSFTLALVEVDNWDNPSPDLKPQIFELSDEKSQIVCVPEGYANGIKAKQDDSILLVYSNKILCEALKDSWRYDHSMWIDWSKY